MCTQRVRIVHNIQSYLTMETTTNFSHSYHIWTEQYYTLFHETIIIYIDIIIVSQDSSFYHSGLQSQYTNIYWPHDQKLATMLTVLPLLPLQVDHHIKFKQFYHTLTTHQPPYIASILIYQTSRVNSDHLPHCSFSFRELNLIFNSTCMLSRLLYQTFWRNFQPH